MNMDTLGDEIERVREHGISFGLSDRAIDECLIRAISAQTTFAENQPHSSEKSSIHSRLRKKSIKCRNWCFWLCSPFLLIFMAYIAASVHKPSGQFLGKLFANASYPIFRYVRLLTLPVTRHTDLSGLHYTQCLLPNPLFSEALIECEPCTGVLEVRRMSKVEAVKYRKDFLGEAEPVLIKEGFEEEITFGEIKKLYEDNEHVFNQSSQPIYSTIETLHDASVLFKKYTESAIQKSPQFHAEWYPSKISHTQVIRTLFRRPSFVPEDTEIALEKAILIDNPRAKPYAVIPGHFVHNYYIQTFGRRRIMLVPQDHCHEVCMTQSVVLKPRDIIYFHAAFWRLDTLPVFGSESSSDISVGYMASFN